MQRTKNKLTAGDAPQTEAPPAGGDRDVVPEAPEELVDGHLDSREIGGPEGPEPTRYGDWERKGRCIDF